jgi:hypothetical protein
MINNIEQLQEFLNSASIPKIKAKPKTFQGIAGQPHYENVLSNLYAFYFDVNEEHGFGDLFIKSFLELIKKADPGKDKQLVFDDGFEVETEFRTIKGGRIDLLLANESNAIIIENKVFHILNNNLKDYWDSITKQKKNKIGVVLSLRKIPNTGHSQFINITHHKFIRKVMGNAGNYLPKAKDKYLIFLKDLYQNIINLSMENMDNKDLDFYLKNQQQICKIMELESSVRKHVYDEVSNACSRFNRSLTLGAKYNKKWRYYLSPNNSNLMLTVCFEELFNPQKKVLYLVVELQQQALENKEPYRSIEFSKEERSLINSDFYENTEDWAHFAAKAYHDISSEQLNSLSEFIYTKYKEDHLLSIFEKLDAFLIQEKQKEERILQES